MKLVAAVVSRARLIWSAVAVLLIASSFFMAGASIPATDLGGGSEPIDLVSDDTQVWPIVLNYGVASNVSNTGWVTIPLPHTYASMIVVGSVNSVAGDPPLVVRVRNASGNDFDLRVDRADGSAASVTGIDVHYVVVEEGIYSVAKHGVNMEALKYTSTATDRDGSSHGEPQGLTNSYTAPVVVGQVMTYNDAGYSAFWARGKNRQSPPSSTKLSTGKHIGEDTDTVRADETIGYIIIEEGSGSIQGFAYTAGLGASSIQGVDDTPPYNYTLSGLSSATVGVVGLAGMTAADGGWPVLYGASPLSATTINLAIEEDQIADAERNHDAEQVAYIVFE